MKTTECFHIFYFGFPIYCGTIFSCNSATVYGAVDKLQPGVAKYCKISNKIWVLKMTAGLHAIWTLPLICNMQKLILASVVAVSTESVKENLMIFVVFNCRRKLHLKYLWETCYHRAGIYQVNEQTAFFTLLVSTYKWVKRS